MDTHTFAPKGACHTVIMLDGYFIWTTHSLPYSKALHMLPGSAFTTFAFLRHEPGIDLDGIGFTRREFFAGFDQKVLR